MKRLIVHVISGLGDGGAEAVLYRLCVNENTMAHRVISLTNDGKYGDLLRDHGIEVVALEMPRGRITISGIFRLWWLLIRARPAAVQTWMYHADLVGGVLARMARVPEVYWGIRHTGLEINDVKRSTIYVAKICARLSCWIPSVIVCCAEKAKEVHRKFGYCSEKLRVIPNGYDAATFLPNDAGRDLLRKTWSVGNFPLIGMVGRFDPLKDHRNLFEALSILKKKEINFRCILVGRDVNYENDKISGWIKEFGLSNDIVLLGQRSDIPEVMAALDIHILSSSSEAFPNVVAEAMISGTPCVTTDVGDAALIVGETGWVVPPSDTNALASGIADALEAFKNKKEWELRCQLAQRRIRDNFSLEKMISRYRNLWNREWSAS